MDITLQDETGKDVTVTLVKRHIDQSDCPIFDAYIKGNCYEITKTSDGHWVATGEPNFILSKVLNAINRVIDDCHKKIKV